MITFDAMPLEKHASLHKISILRLFGIKTKLSPHLIIAFNFNLQTQLQDNIKAHIIFHLRDVANARDANFSINNIKRWRLHIGCYTSFMDFLQKMKRALNKRYQETEKMFLEYGATLSVIEDEWSQYAEPVYQLYSKVAKKNGAQLYDLNFFRAIAKLKDYKLMCVWYNSALIGALVMIDEEPIFHSAIVAVDYEHSTKCRAYSYMHYMFIRLAIEANKYTIADVGITADKPKSLLSCYPVSSCMDIYANNYLLKSILRILSRFTSATINSESKLEFNFHFSRNNFKP